MLRLQGSGIRTFQKLVNYHNTLAKIKGYKNFGEIGKIEHTSVFRLKGSLESQSLILQLVRLKTLVGNLEGIFKTDCFCQTSEKWELMVKASSTHPPILATVLLSNSYFWY
ncbi:hypothetical protein AAFM79_16200 [Trichormus azollae HNT15244]